MYPTVAMYVFFGVVFAFIINALYAHDKSKGRQFRWKLYLLWLLGIIALAFIAYGLKTLLGIQD